MLSHNQSCLSLTFWSEYDWFVFLIDQPAIFMKRFYHAVDSGHAYLKMDSQFRDIDLATLIGEEKQRFKVVFFCLSSHQINLLGSTIQILIFFIKKQFC
jgi:hypothetical protein